MKQTWSERLKQATVAVRSIGPVCLLGAFLAAPTAAQATGAVAIGLPADVAQDGISMFIFVNASSASEARTKAVEGCKTVGSQTARNLCKVMATFNNQCAAEALDPKDGTPGFGWAIADTEAEAKSMALANCRDTAGPDRQDACEVPAKGIWCDGRARR
ncbi:MAG TPA: DUF4189 domain-containing protein [Xanthobacteraceae bacterium]|jgi:hypothetical protein|nr:DUF4189 domain-containing protein [Xanthobacteraceae bacterium]